MIKKKIIKMSLASAVLVLLLAGCQTQPNLLNAEEDTQKAQSTGEEEILETSQSESAVPEETASESAASETEAEYPYDFTDPASLQEPDILDHLPVAPVSGVTEEGKYFNLKAVDDYRVMQGGCTDGKYVYLILNDPNGRMDGDEWVPLSLLFKVDMDGWEIVKTSEPLEVDHANSITYNAKLGQLILAHGESHGKGAPNDISFLDPDSLEILDRRSLEQKIYAISYCEARDQYVVGIQGTPDLAVLDAEFDETDYFEGHKVLGNQNIDCDEKYIYVGNSGVGTKRAGTEVVKVYGWDGAYKGIFRLGSVSEQEALFHVGEDYYVTFYTAGGRVYRVEYDFSLLKE